LQAKNPAQKTILKRQKKLDLGCKLSIDINYAKTVEKSKKKGYQNYCQFNPLIKISE
jgi:fructokinase